MTFKELDKILKNEGWEKDSKGNGSSHIMYRKEKKKSLSHTIRAISRKEH